jgi:hypothetical protein
VAGQQEVADPSPDHPLYTKHRLGPGSNLWLISVNEGWRSTIVASGMYENTADWLIEQIQGKPFPWPGSVTTEGKNG